MHSLDKSEKSTSYSFSQKAKNWSLHGLRSQEIYVWNKKKSGVSQDSLKLAAKLYVGQTPDKNKEISMTLKNLLIRDEKGTDHNAISEVTISAFKKMEISNHTEQFIIEALRSTKALSLSLVAEVDGSVVGHIAFSPVTMSDGAKDWYGLGPVSVHPDSQRKGIGKALVREGLLRLKDLKAKGCCLVGHPQYYRQFGFENIEGLIHEGVPPEVFFVLSFDGNIPQGFVLFHEGFKANGQQGVAADG
jgi:putative acetyltransferase